MLPQSLLLYITYGGGGVGMPVLFDFSVVVSVSRSSGVIKQAESGG